MFLLRGDIRPKDVHGQKLSMVQLKAVHAEQGGRETGFESRK